MAARSCQTITSSPALTLPGNMCGSVGSSTLKNESKVCSLRKQGQWENQPKSTYQHIPFLPELWGTATALLQQLGAAEDERQHACADASLGNEVDVELGNDSQDPGNDIDLSIIEVGEEAWHDSIGEELDVLT